MRGIDATSGQPLEGLAHLRQSLRDVLATPVGSRVLRRDYGSRIFELVDRPVNAAWIADLYAFAAEAIDRWEPRLRLTRVRLVALTDEGKPELDLEGIYLPEGQPVTLEGIVL